MRGAEFPLQPRGVFLEAVDWASAWAGGQLAPEELRALLVQAVVGHVLYGFDFGNGSQLWTA